MLGGSEITTACIGVVAREIRINDDTLTGAKASDIVADMHNDARKLMPGHNQLGVDFSHTAIHRFEPEKALALATAVKMHDSITFEAHSTDCQPINALAELVNKHYFFLKAGPELTFRMLEAVCALAQVEKHVAPESTDLEYYWTVPSVRSAMKKAILNLNYEKIPETIVSQYFPDREFGSLDARADQLISLTGMLYAGQKDCQTEYDQKRVHFS